MVRDKLFAQILDQVYDGENVMCCFPRNAGKTHLIVELLERPLQDSNVLLLVSNRILGKEIIKRCNKKIEIGTYSDAGLVGFRGRTDIDCVIFEDPGPWTKPDVFNQAIDLVKAWRCQVILAFTPFVYDAHNPHPLKVLWDTAPYYKYQMTPSGLDWYEDILVDRDHYTNDDFQSEIEGNWVAR